MYVCLKATVHSLLSQIFVTVTLTWVYIFITISVYCYNTYTYKKFVISLKLAWPNKSLTRSTKYHCIYIHIGQIFINIYIIKRCNDLKILLDKSVKTLINKLILCINVLVWYRFIKLCCNFMFWWQFILKYTQTNVCGRVALIVNHSYSEHFVMSGPYSMLYTHHELWLQ